MLVTPSLIILSLIFQDDFLALKCETDLDDLCEIDNDVIDSDDKMIVGHHQSWDPDV